MDTQVSKITERTPEYIIGKPFHTTSGTYHGAWKRRDLYTPTGNYDCLFVLDAEDQSPIYEHWKVENYDSKCPECYLNFAHSTNEHIHNINK